MKSPIRRAHTQTQHAYKAGIAIEVNFYGKKEQQIEVLTTIMDKTKKTKKQKNKNIDYMYLRKKIEL